MKDLLLTLLACAVVTATATDASAQRGGGGRGGFGNNGNAPSGDAAPPSALPQAPPNFGAPSSLPTAPPGAFAAPPAAPAGASSTQLPSSGFTPAPASSTTPRPATAPSTPAAGTPAGQQGGSDAFRAKNPMVRVVDGKISMRVTDVTLEQLVKLLDTATNKNSRVKKDIASKKVNVRFEDLEYDEAVRKIFQGVALDYILLDDGVFVTGNAGAVTNSTTAAAATQVRNEPPPPPAGSGPPMIGADSPFSANPLTPNVNPFGEQPQPPVAAAPQGQQPPQGAQAPPQANPFQQQDFNNQLSNPGISIFGAPGGGGGNTGPGLPAPPLGGAAAPNSFGVPLNNFN